MNSFTLVEVVIAIGVTVFVLMSILSLMVYVAQIVRQSDQYTRLAIIAEQVQATVASEPFAQTPYGVGLHAGTLPVSTNYYFTWDGLPTNSAGAYYQCTVADATPNPARFPLSAGGEQLIEPVQILIYWPKTATSKFANTNIIVTSIPNYD